MPNSATFLDAFAAIERYLRQECRAEQGVPFYQLVEQASRMLPTVRRCRDDLKEFADLRNAIVHERSGGRVIAEPNDLTTETIRKLASLLLTPPTVLPTFQVPVCTLPTTESIGAAVKLMKERSFSQMPLTGDRGHLVGLLTTNTIARWLGANAAADVFSLRETTIAQVFSYTEDKENHVVVNREATLAGVLEQFQGFEARGKTLEAVLVTHSGKSTEKPMGILTISDLPAVLSKLEVQTAN